MTTTNTPPDSLLLPLDGIDSPAAPNFRFENAYWNEGYANIAGVDEAGRGPLAGPVVAAAVILDPRHVPDGLNDSKKLTERTRERLYGEIVDMARAVCVVSQSSESIDTSNILRASLTAMRIAVEGLALAADSALFDGRDIPSDLSFRARPLAVIKGDSRSLSIAAASVIAKVTRDRMMLRLGPFHSQYRLERHKGYGSQAHREAIGIHGGIARVHRFTFAPLRK